MKDNCTPNDLFVRKHFQELVKKYAQKKIVICEGKVFTGPKAIQKARSECPKSVPLLLPVPSPKKFDHILV